MKRIASLFLAFVMVCMVCAVSVPVYADDFDKAVGVWKLEEMSGDNTMSKEDLKEYERLGVAMYLKLRKDGTCKFSLYGDTMEGTWSEYGIVLDNAWFTYILDGDKLVLDNQDGSDMIFTRSSMDEIYKILGYQKGILDEDVHYSTKEKKILDTDIASVVITGYKADMTGFTVSMRCKNKTRNEITIGLDKCVLNKYIFHPEWSETLDKRETLETKMRIIPAEIAKTGISVVDEMILQMHLSNATNGRTIKKGIMATVYPTGRKADQVRTPLRKPVENEYRILVNNTCAYIIQGIDPEDTRGLAVNCYLENRSKGTLNFVWSDVTIDGKPAKTVYEESVLPGTIGYSDVIFLKSEFEGTEINISDLSTIKGKLRVYDKTKTTPQLVQEKEFTYTRK
jgi:hypothetical protein